MAVRSNYIKSLMETKKTLEEQMQEVVSESMKGIIGDNAKDEVRKLLKESEDEDSFSEEEVTDDTATTDKDKTAEVDDVTTTDDGEEVTTDTVDTEEDGEPDYAVEDDVWDELEKCKSADGEFDCRGMDDGNLLKVLKAMGPEDGIRVMKNDDGSIAVEVDGDLIQGQEEFVIDLDDLDDLDETEYAIECECNESNTGYITSDYQKETAMTTPDNHEPANPKTTYSMDGGVPTGVEKPFANQGDKAPYDETVNEEMMTRKGREGKITTKDSKIDCYVIPTDEELMIARDTYALAVEEGTR